MKMLTSLYAAIIILSTASYVAAQEKLNSNQTNTAEEKNILVAERNPFLVDKRHGAITKVNKNTNATIDGNMKTRNRNIFFDIMRHQ